MRSDDFPVVPPITEIPDYVWAPQYGRSSWLPGRPSKRPEETGRLIPHSSSESALLAAKRACRAHPGRWFGRSTIGTEKTAFLVYEDSKVIERHVVS